MLQLHQLVLLVVMRIPICGVLYNPHGMKANLLQIWTISKEDVFQHRLHTPFDILKWWQVHAGRYPILSKLARDILTIPISTVASESAFSAGGHVLDDYRSSLTKDTVEMLVCGGDWIRAGTKAELQTFQVSSSFF